jgi:uncharacterized membrane protein YfcA
MYFPVAGIEISPWIPPAVAFTISFFTSMGGVSGAFLLLPFQISVLGFSSPAVSATNHLFNVVAIPGGVWRYCREGRMVWPITWVIVIGTLPGVVIGVLFRIRYLARSEDFKLFVGMVLLYLGARLAMDLLRKGNADRCQTIAEERFQRPLCNSENLFGLSDLPKAIVRRFDVHRIVYEFCGQEFDLHIPSLMFLSLAVGFIGGIYGIGGGAIIAPFLVTFFRIPVYVAAGAALMGSFVTSAAGVWFYHLLAPLYPDTPVSPDWVLGLLFGVGGIAGMYCGARMQKFIPAAIVKTVLAVCILVPAIGYIRSSLRRPV